MWDDFVEYNLIRTNFLSDFISKDNMVEAEALPYFLYKYAEYGNVLEAYISYKRLYKHRKGEYSIDNVPQNVLDKANDYADEWYRKDKFIVPLGNLFPDMMNSNYDIKSLEKDIPNFSPISILEFYKIVKGTYYVGYDLDEELQLTRHYIRENDFVEHCKDNLEEYFSFRHNNYPLSLLGEFSSSPIGIRGPRKTQYRKTGVLGFETPKEYYKYPIDELFKKYFVDADYKDSRIVNIRGTNGCGKTTMVNNIYLDSVAKNKAEEHFVILKDVNDRERKKSYDVLTDKKIILLGGYNTPRGTKGVDRMTDVYEIIHGLLYVVGKYPGYTIILESSTLSTSFWSYCRIFKLLEDKGISINIVSLWCKDWNFVVNNVKNRTVRKEGSKEPLYEEILIKRYIIYKNHFRFTGVLKQNSTMVLYPDTYAKEELTDGLRKVIKEITGKELYQEGVL